MTHPFDLHPLRGIAAEAWNEVKKDSQPLYDDLSMESKSRLLDTARQVESGDPNIAFACAVAENLARAKMPAIEEAVEEDSEEVTTPEEKEHLDLKGPLPADFPAHDKLHEAGINTYPQLNKVDDLTEIEGIGAATVKAIKKRLKADAKTLNA